MAPGGTGVDPEPRCWDEPKDPGPWPLARLAARFTTFLFRTAPKPPEGSSGAARRDFRSSGQPCGIDVTLISSEQQQASVISQISDGCRGLSRFAMAMFLDVLEILWHRTVYLETVIRQACVAEPQQPGSQPALAAKSQSPCLTSSPALLSKLIGLCKPHNTTLPPPQQPTKQTAQGCRLLVARKRRGKPYQIDCTSRGTGLSLRDEMNCQRSAANPDGLVLSLPQLWSSGNRNVTSCQPLGQRAITTPRTRGPRGKTTKREAMESAGQVRQVISTPLSPSLPPI